MGEKTKIAWCDHTWNPWRGCERVSPGCDNCYAERWARRSPKLLGYWGKDAPRVPARPAGWDAPYRWNRAAKAAGQVRTVFVGSMMDFCEDRPDLVEPRNRAWRIIQDCRHLMFLLLSKRPENFYNFLPWSNGSDTRVWPNVAIGATIENQGVARLRNYGLQEPAALRFWSLEPLLEPIGLDQAWANSRLPDWVIVGGESGPSARPCQIEWIGEIVWQCRNRGVPVFVKQLGENAKKFYRQGEFGLMTDGVTPSPSESGVGGFLTEDPKGGDPEEWPTWLRVRQFPVWPATPAKTLTPK